MTGMLNLASIIAEEREKLRRAWGGFVALGVLLAVLGVLGIAFAFVFTMLMVLLIGWFFLIGGVAEAVHAIMRKGWSSFWLDLISGLITAVAGMLIVLHPFAGATLLTIFLGAMFLVGGIFRIGVGIAIRNPYAGWFVLHGCISLLLGVLIIGRTEESAKWVIGTLVAIDLLINGVRLIMFGLALRRLPRPEDDDYRTRHADASPPADAAPTG
jgi:uncharacterized membrane protein HdeD (DUF308 family)